MRQILPIFIFPYVMMATLALSAYVVLFTPVGVMRGRELHGFFELPRNQFNFYAVLPAVLGFKNSSFFTQDARPQMLEEFIKKYHSDSPLLPYTYFIVETADRYNLPFSIIPAIAMQESHLCRTIPYESNNCWGLGIYGTKVWRFATYEEAIESVGRTLSHYQNKGRVQPEDIMKLYTPSSDGSWARAVRHFMDEIQEGK